MNRPFLTINIKGRLMDFRVPKVMGILNVTPDSFYSGSRLKDSEDAGVKALEMIEEGADIIDVGGCSTRPGSQPVDEETEYRRVSVALEGIRKRLPDAVISLDTFRSSIARKCIENQGVDIINDISGGTYDPKMWETVAEYQVAYVLSHIRGNLGETNQRVDYNDITADVITDLSKKLYELRGLKINDVILDPGFGFAKSVEQNFQLLDELNEFCKIGLPVLAGLSRKSMIWKTLDSTPEDALAGTIALNAVAIERGADIIRVHDVREAKETVKLLTHLHQAE